VRPGDHLVQRRIDWGRSEPLGVGLNARENAHLACHGRTPLLFFYWLTVGHGRYIALEKEDAPA
jgi:hypothetical protein